MIFNTARWTCLVANFLWAGLGLHAQDLRATLPNGREIRPVGSWTRLAPYPFAIALRTDGTEAAIPSIGFPFALNIVTHLGDSAPSVHRLPETELQKPEVETHAGLAYSPDGSVLYVATGDSGKVAIYTTRDWKKTDEIALDGIVPSGKTRAEFSGSFAANLILSSSGRWLYALDQGNWRVVIFDTQTRARVATIETGAYPFGLTLSPDGKRLYVTNTGLFEYSAVSGVKTGATKTEAASTGLHFPPSGYPSKLARKGGIVEGRTVPGLGDENSTRGSSLWTYAIDGGTQPIITAKLRLGTRITEARGATVGGAAPTGVVASADAVYVALTHQDSIAKVSADGTRLIRETPLSPFNFVDHQGRPLRGVMPSGVTLGGNKLYVAESGINAVAVLDPDTLQLLEHIPVGWNPSAVVLSPNGRTLYVVNAKGRGTGPNGGAAHDSKDSSYIGTLEYGSLTSVDLATLPSASQLTATVVAANSNAIAHQPTLPRLKHCFLIIRENRTYDEVLGDLPGANGDASLARYGLSGWAEEAGPGSPPLKVTPNLHALVNQFATSDNFFVDSDVSADGHRWLMGINPTPFFNTAWTSNYGGRRKASPTATQPGRRALFGGADAPMPEDEPQFGSLWEHVANSGLGILNYGEGLEVEGNDEADGLEPEGQRLLLNSPVPRPIFESSDRRFPTFNLGIPDQLRAAEFERDLSRRMTLGKVPALIVIRLPNDHTSSIRPGDGYPYRASFVADNDLALGKIVAFLSRTALWKDSAVFITEDDAQGGVDHVDAHRSILAITSPWVKPGMIAHGHSSMGSITRTIDELLGLGPLNLEDALAGELTDVFDTTPHTEKFDVRPSDVHVFDPAKARVARPKTKIEAAQLRDIDDPDDIRPQVESTAHKRRKDKDDKD
jgi:YVTN family beta-propeller protein